MHVFRVMTIIALALLLGAAGTAQAGSKHAEAQTDEILLSNGQTIRGVIRPYQESRYIVEGEIIGKEVGGHVFYDIPADQIKSVNGGEQLPPYRRGERVITTERYERVLENGDLETWTRIESQNRSSRLQTYVSWGASERELPGLRDMILIDPFGNELSHRIEERQGGGYTVTVDLRVPIVPGETLIISQKLLSRKVVKKNGELFSFTFMGAFSEDRLLLRKVELPAGAEIESCDPEPSHILYQDDRPLITWQRYYAADEQLPVTVTYRLP